MDPDDKLNRLMQESGLFDSDEADNTAADIFNNSASSEDEWTPNMPRKTKSFKFSADIHQPPAAQSLQGSQHNQSCEHIPTNLNEELSVPSIDTSHCRLNIPSFSQSFQVSQSSENISADLNHELPLGSTDTSQTLNIPSFPVNTHKHMKLNEKTGVFEPESEPSSEFCDGMELTLNPETGLFEMIEAENETLDEVRTGKKRISRQEQWKRNKKIKNNLKNHILEDLPNCRCNCKNKLSKTDVKTVFTKFVNLESHTEQNIYLQGCLQEINPQRFRPRRDQALRERRVFEYIINLPKKSIKVCQKVFLVIHGIKRDRLVCKIQHKEKDISDGRGRQSHPKLDIESMKKVHEFIKNLPARQSHYSRASSKHRKFLDSHLSIAELHRKFCNDYPECGAVSYEKFRCIFNQDFNISFGQPRKDICTTCEKFKVDITSAELTKDTTKVKQLKSAHELHLRKAEVFLKSLTKVENEKPSNVLSLCFDFQKKLPLPVTNISDEYYLRQLWLHNFGVHDLCKNTATMFLFTENYAHKGPNEVITALNYYITQEKTPGQHQLDLYCDNAFSQNKNRYVFTYLDQLCAKGIFEKITVSYPVPGHSMMPIDRDFALIERKRKKQEKIYAPEYYVELIKNSKNKNKFHIVFLEKTLMKEGDSENIVLKVKDFKKLYDERIKSNLPGISKCRKVIFKKIGKPEFSMSMKGQDMRPFSLYKVGYSRRINEMPADCYDFPLTIKAAKLKDIKRLLESVPESERYFYEDLFRDSLDPTIIEELDSADEVE